jgi:lipopolysaccharide exporter
VVTRGLNLLVTVLLARMLAPEGMGVVAASLLMVELIDTWRDFGLRDALIYEPRSDPVVPSTAFALIITAALAQSLVLLAIAPLAPLVVEDAVIVSLLVWLSLLFPINALGSVQDAMLQKQLKFVLRGLADVFGAIVKLAATYVCC